MTIAHQKNRRREKSNAFRLGQPAFIQVPRTVAATAFVLLTLLVIAANRLTGSAIWYGPVYLLICAFSAWFVGNRYAVTLGLFIMAIQTVSGHIISISRVPEYFSINLALQFCSALAIVLMLGVAREALEIEWKYARIDPLTGALNRKAFFEAVEANQEREGQAVLIYADLDQLKRLNDRLGHESGDMALRNFADRVKSTIRKDDLFSRIGGDEFVILLNVLDLAAAIVVATRLNNALNHRTDGDQATLRCSLGVLLLPTGSTAIDEELRLADTLMYHAKREQAGLVMGWSNMGKVEMAASLTPEVIAIAAQRSAVRSAERKSQITFFERPADKSKAA